MRTTRFVVVVCALITVVSQALQGQGTLPDVVNRAGAYVEDFERRLTGIVAEETYLQEFGPTRRELKSDFLLIAVPSSVRFVEFRDVYEVDGRGVRNRDDRLSRLFLDSSASASEQLRAIVTESARYNIGSIQRTINTPLLPLLFLRRDNQHGSTFKLTTRSAPELLRLSLATTAQSSAFGAIPAGTIVLEFDEKQRDTLIRRSGDRDLPARGRFWIEPMTGRVLMTELVADDTNVIGTVDVRYEWDSTLGLTVPVEMRERYNAFGRATIFGRATYARFRSFRVDTSTDIQDVSKDAKPR